MLLIRLSGPFELVELFRPDESNGLFELLFLRFRSGLVGLGTKRVIWTSIIIRNI